MSKLIYITNTSLDGYVDEAGAFDWVNPIKFTPSSLSRCSPPRAPQTGPSPPPLKPIPTPS